MLDLNIHESQAFEDTISACEPIYGNSFDQMVEKISKKQNLTMLTSILANSMESKLSMVRFFVVLFCLGRHYL
jgi:hypothetical protein